MPRCPAISVGLLAAGLAWTVAARAAGLVELQGWDGPGVLLPHGGPGPEHFRISAHARWSPEAPPDPRLYEVRVTLPDGRVLRQSLPPGQGPGGRRVGGYVPASAVRNLRADAVRVELAVYFRPTGTLAGSPLSGGIEAFPTPATIDPDPRPYGWGRPLEPRPGTAASLPVAGPDGLRFVRIFGGAGVLGFSIATTEATIGQVARRLGDHYDSRAGRGDNLDLDRPEQPALNLRPADAVAYLDALSAGDSSGMTYRLPTREEWLKAARAGGASVWWQGEPPPANVANFLGDESAVLEGDVTAPARPLAIPGEFLANPFGLYHTFGNVAEWATTDRPGVYARMGGHFRTDPRGEAFAREIAGPTVAGDDQIGAEDDPGRAFVGVRPVFDVDAEQGARIVRSLLNGPEYEGIAVAYDPDRAVATLSGPVPNSAVRRQASDRLRSLPFLAAVVDTLQPPAPVAGQSLFVSEAKIPAARRSVQGRWADLVPVAVQVGETLPVTGSAWWINAYLPDGQVLSQPLPGPSPVGPGGVSYVGVPLTNLRAAGIPDGGPISVALSLGGPASSTSDPRIASNVASIRWTADGDVPNARRDRARQGWGPVESHSR